MTHPSSPVRRSAPIGPRFPARTGFARTGIVSFGLILLAGCAGGQGVTTISAPQGPALSPLGLQRILGATSHQLTQMLGRPAQNVTEGQGTRIQFAGPVCVLDAYLYPKQAGGTPVVTYLDARRPNGDDIDRASCVAAFTAR